MKKGFSAIEILVVLAIMVLMSVIILNGFLAYRHSQIVSKDTELVVEVLRKARSLTLASKNSSSYGVHFEIPSVVIFTGPTYSAGASDNQVSTLNPETQLAVTLTGGGDDVLFERLSGETAEDGTVVVSSQTSSTVKTITIHKTGLIEVQ